MTERLDPDGSRAEHDADEEHRRLGREIAFAGYEGEHHRYWEQYLLVLAFLIAVVLLLVFWPK